MTLDRHAKPLRQASRLLAAAACSDRSKEQLLKEMRQVLGIVMDVLVDLSDRPKPPKRR